MESKSQFGQDLHVVDFYKGKRNGYFVEVGAYDGVESSNTYILEKSFGWDGICIECNPKFYSKLVTSRSCKLFDCAVYNENDKVMEFFDSGGYAGLVETNNHSHILNDPIIKVKTKTLTTILEEANAPSFIEYLSLDTEGSEFEILNAHDFDKFKFGFICVEHNRIEKNRSKIRDLLLSKGYIFKGENGDSRWGIIDDEYVLKEMLPA